MTYEYYLYSCEGTYNARYLSHAIHASVYDPKYPRLVPFDAVAAAEELGRYIADAGKTDAVKITAETFQDGAFAVCADAQAQLVRVCIDVQSAEAVLPFLLAAACARRLTLADPLKPDPLLWSPLMQPQKGLFLCRERAAKITDELREKLGEIEDIVQLSSRKDYWYFSNLRRCRGCAEYAVVRKSGAEASGAERWASDFCRILQGNLLKDETLEFWDRSFIIDSEESEYSLVFCLEAFINEALVTLHMDCVDPEGMQLEHLDLGLVTTVKLERPSILSLHEEALALSPEGSKNPIFRRMGLRRMIAKYKNPVDRLAASITLEKKLRLFGDDLQYDSIPRSVRGMIVLHEMDYRSMREEDESRDALIMGESLFGLLYHPIVQCFPGGMEYYSFLNLIGPMQCSRIAESLKNIAWYAENDPDSPELDEYLRQTSIDGIEQWAEYQEDSDDLESRRACLKRNRDKFCAFLSIMIDWFGDGPELYGTQDWGINICGL